MLPPVLLNSRANTFRMGDTGDGYNASPTQSDDYGTAVLTGVPCRVGAQSSRQRYRNSLQGVVQDVSSVVIFMDYYDPATGVMWDIQERDRFVVGGRNYDTVNVTDVDLAHHHLEIVAQVVT